MKLMMFNFACPECNHQFEKLAKSDATDTPCPMCGNLAEKAVSAPAGFKFNGRGFYETDFKNKA